MIPNSQPNLVLISFVLIVARTAFAVPKSDASCGLGPHVRISAKSEDSTSPNAEANAKFNILNFPFRIMDSVQALPLWKSLFM